MYDAIQITSQCRDEELDTILFHKESLEEICVLCGCSKNWHSLSSKEFIPAASGCLGCRKCSKFVSKGK